MQTGHAEYQLRCASKDDEKNMKFWLHALTTAVDSVRGEVGASLTVPADNEGQEGAEVDLDEGEGLGAAGGGASADGLAEDDTEARQDRALSEFVRPSDLPAAEAAATAATAATAAAAAVSEAASDEGAASTKLGPPPNPRAAPPPASNIVALGSSGFVGLATVEALHKTQSIEVPIVVGVSDPSNQRLDPLQRMAPKISLATVDLANKASVAASIQENSVVFLVPPGSVGEGTASVDAIDAAVEKKASHIVCLSVIAPPGASSFAKNSFGGQFQQVEERLWHHARRGTSATTYTIVRVAMFMDNWMAQPMRAEGKIIAPLEPTQPFSIVCARDIGEACANILKDPSKYVDRVMYLSGLTVTFEQVAADMTEVMGRKVEYQKITYEKCKEFMLERKMPEWAADGSIDVYKGQASNDPRMVMREATFDDPPDAVANHTKLILGREATGPKEWGFSVYGHPHPEYMQHSPWNDRPLGHGQPIPKSYPPNSSIPPAAPTSSAQSNLKPLSKQGVMKKAGHLNPSMRTRHFVLSNQSTYGYTLKYYASNPASGDKAKGEIKMRGAQVRLGDKPKRLVVVESSEAGGKIYKMECNSDADMRDWRAVLTDAAQR
jgi:nucleoside-diphosphate-sugar epimerase